MFSEVTDALILIGCYTAILLFIWIIVRHGTLLMGFTIFAGFYIFVGNISAFFIAKTFLIPLSFDSPGQMMVNSYTVCGLLAYALGIWFGWKPMRQGQVLLNPFELEPKLILSCAVIGGVIMLFARLLPYIPTISPMLFKLSLLIQVAFLGALVYGLEKGDYYRLIVAIAIFIPVGMISTVLTGFAGMLGSFMLHPVLLFLFYRRPAWWKAGVFASVVYVFFMVASVWFLTRGIIREGGLEGLGTVERIPAFYGQFARAAGSSGAVYSPEAVLGAAAMRVDLSIYNVQEATWVPDNEPYSFGRSLFIDPLLALVPRFLWPGKTINLGDSEFINRFTGLGLSNSSISVDTNVTFELFANFGWPGVVLGLFVYGYLMARAELKLFTPGNSLTQVFVLLILLLGLSTGGRRAAAMVLENGAAVAGAFILGKILERVNLMRKRFDLPGEAPAPAESSIAAVQPRPVRRRWPPREDAPALPLPGQPPDLV